MSDSRSRRRQAPVPDDTSSGSASGGIEYRRLTFDVPESMADDVVSDMLEGKDVIQVEQEQPPEDPDMALTFALARAQAAFPTIQKTKTGEVRGKNKDGQPYSYEYKYADLGDVLAAVRPVLAANGLALLQRTHHDDHGKIILTTYLRHVRGGQIDSVVELGQSSGNPQAFGGALTYLRRYEAVTLLGIAAEEDTDAQHVEPERRSNGNGNGNGLPTWAREATQRQRNEAGRAIASVLGNAPARGFVAGADSSFGYMPSGMASFTVALINAIRQTLTDDVIAAAVNVRNAQDAERAAVETKEAQDKAAEEPDASPVDAEPEEEEGPPPASAQRPVPEFPQASLKLDDPRAREACTCPEGFDAAQEDPDKRDDQCPVETHGIPF